MPKTSKQDVLQKIYAFYHDWIDDKEFACARGCSLCCTRNVMVTAPEAELVLEQVRKASLREWLASRLTAGNNPPCRLTMNEWAKQCISAGTTQEESDSEVLEPCGLLAEDQSCPIYEARPFACRCFASVIPCRVGGKAGQPRELTAINTAVMQIIEHLGQGEIYGALGNVLPILCNKEEYGDLADHLPAGFGAGNLKGLRRARPLPAFVTEPEDRQTVREFLDALFQERVNGKSLQDILNNG